ncbi:MAG: YraN family protein [Rikenellaceae bacterium]
MAKLSHNNRVGRVGEDIAANYITNELGMQIIERNWRKQSKEIDIIAIKDNCLRIVEIKSRMESNKESVTASLNDNKLRSLVKGAALYLSTFRLTDVDEIFFDLIVVTFDEQGDSSIEYMPKFFYPQW